MKNEKTKAIIVDIDGTLATLTDRGPHDYHLIKQDVKDIAVFDVVLKYAASGDYHIIIITGRDMEWKDDTLEWLKENRIPFDLLYMRAHKDRREDTEVKKEIYNKYVKNNFDILFVLEDRSRVVKMWRELGLKVFQVVDGDY